MRILAIFAHPDDELGCVGSLCKHAQRGDEVMLAWTTHGALASQFAGVASDEVRRTRLEHGRWVAEQVGAEHHFFDMGDSYMTGSRDEALQLARLYATWKPDAIITWSDDHPHPDHRMTAKIVFDAITLARIPKIINEGLETVLEPHRQPVKLYQYVSSRILNPLLHVDISEHIDTVTEIFRYYQEFYGWQHSPEQFRQARAMKGREAGVDYAESFQLRQSFLPAYAYLP